MFNTPPSPTTRRHIDTTVRTRSAWKKEQLLFGTDMKDTHPANDIKSEITKNTAKPVLSKRPRTDGDSLQPRAHNVSPKKNSSNNSVQSLTSLEARRRQLQYEAAKEKADIEKRLIDQRLAADLAALENQSKTNKGSREQESELDSVEKVQQWLEHSHVSEKHVSERHSDHRATELDIVNEISKGNRLLMARLTSSKDLPQFHGDPLEWLTFRQAYEETTKFCKYSDAENMWRLRKSLRGEAKETVSSLLIGNTAPHTIIEALELRYGRPETIINKITSLIRKIPPLSQNYHSEIVSFSIKIKNFVAATQAIKQTDYLRSPELVSSVLNKCPSVLVNKWADYYSTTCNTEKPKLEMLSEFLYIEANKISAAGLTHLQSHSELKRKSEDRKHSVHLTEKQVNDTPPSCKFCHLSHHKLTECTRFKRAMTKDRWRFVRMNKLCHKCLLASHNRDTCSAATCGVNECALPHHRLLHWKSKAGESENIKPNSDNSVAVKDNITPSGSLENSETVAYANDSSKTSVFLKVVPIKLHGPQGMISTYALLDDGATVSLISSDIANSVNLNGHKQTLCVRGAWNSELICKSEIVDFTITSMNNKTFKLSARKISELNLPLQKLSNINIKNYEHLQQLSDFIMCSEDVKPQLLIGQDNYHLIAPIKTIMKGKNEPCATLTPLGWCVHGIYPERQVKSEYSMLTVAEYYHPDTCTAHFNRQACTSVAANSVSLVAAHTGGTYEATADSLHSNNILSSRSTMTCDCLQIHCPDAVIQTDVKNDAHIDELVRKSFMFESIGVHNKPRQNIEVIKAIEIVESSAKLIDGRWEVGLPWKDPNTRMVDSYCNAYRRLKTMERKMAVDEGFSSRYKERVDHLFINDYARKVTPDEDKNRFDKTWYLPHFGVDNPNKKKLRLVYDAAATSAGQSLNDYLLSGPNLLESLLGIMFRFRERPIGLTGDIKDMFLRVKIKSDDQHALRFLWREGPDKVIEKYVMTSLIFGANCSPFIAQHIKNKNAQRFITEMPEAVEAIIKNHFMDDYIDCFDSADIALKTMKEVAYIHQQGGFEMRNWTSNSQAVCSGTQKETLSAAAVGFKVDEDSRCERVLGLLWYPDSDTFGFSLSLNRIPEKLLSGEKKPTKRELLRIVMSIFDVYGLLAPFTIQAKIIMQYSWKTDLHWDDEIGLAQFELFKNWIEQLHTIKHLRIPRWYFFKSTSGTEENCKRLELHVFCDASPAAYAAVAYWRTEINNNVFVSFIASKSRVAPLKPVTIPRMELQAAVLACRLAATIQKEHKLQPIERKFWSDSTTVLHWIRNKSRNYKQFVANRLGEIDELCQACEWHYIPTDKNIADIATKNNSYKLHNECEWFQGPKLLYEKEDSSFIFTPEKEKELINEDILEKINNIQVMENISLPVPDLDKFSSWLRLLRCTATVLLFIEKCRKTGTTEIEPDMLQRAEVLLLRYSQNEMFAKEINLLKNNKPIQNDSRLRTLTPYLDAVGLLRVGGRVEATSDVTSQTKHPIILDGRHRIALMIARRYHEKFAHGNNETIVNELRQKYWLLNLRPTVRSVASKCLLCRIRKAVPSVPRMADLPEARLAHHSRAFTHCGVDLFGPMDVIVGRRRERRYGVLFTCMTIRAIHIEMVPSLTTDSFIMALRRMAARRGWPHCMYSDNGTNLRGAEAELKRSYQELRDTVKTEMTNRGVTWNFNSPISPHKGGAWERLIRSVKTALKVTLKERAPREETLATLLAEIENMVNGRPLTHVSVDPYHMEALTPNHFLIGCSSNMPVPGVFDDSDLHVRKMWRIAQRLADMFWQRWIKEVLPSLIPRQKWYKENENLQPGNVVIVIDPNSPRNIWPKGIIKNVYPGKDGRVRTVDVKTRAGILTRPVTRLALLPVAD